MPARTVQFLRLRAEHGFSFVDFLTKLQELEAVPTDSPDHQHSVAARKVPLTDLNYLLGWCEGAPSDGKLILGKVRTGAFPLLEEDGKLRTLGVAVNAGLAETAHIMFFANNVIGVEYNHFGARVSDLVSYLQYLNFARNVHADPLARADLVERFRKVTAYSKVAFWLSPSDLTRASRAQTSIQAALAACGASADQGVIVKVEIVPMKGEDHLPPASVSLTNNLAQDMIDGSLMLHKLAIDGYEDITAKGETRRHIDFVRDLMKVHVQVDYQSVTSKAIDTTSAFRAIGEAYREHRNEIEAASILGIRNLT
jgi:hypothetical protein